MPSGQSLAKTHSWLLSCFPCYVLPIYHGGWHTWMAHMDDTRGWHTWMTHLDGPHGWHTWMTHMDDTDIRRKRRRRSKRVQGFPHQSVSYCSTPDFPEDVQTTPADGADTPHLELVFRCWGRSILTYCQGEGTWTSNLDDDDVWRRRKYLRSILLKFTLSSSLMFNLI